MTEQPEYSRSPSDSKRSGLTKSLIMPEVTIKVPMPRSSDSKPTHTAVNSNTVSPKNTSGNSSPDHK
jgi:hypothetical protein